MFSVNMQTFLTIFLTVLLASYLVQCVPSSECQAWYNMEKYVLKKSDILSCKTKENCTGLNCTGKMQEESFYAAIQINSCENPASIKLSANIPQLGIHSWEKVFTQKATFDLSGQVEGELDMKHSYNNIIVGLKVKVISSIQKHIPSLRGVPLEQQIFQDAVIPVPPCNNDSSLQGNGVQHSSMAPGLIETSLSDLKSASKPKGNCSIYNSSCAAEETCKQLDKSFDAGICVCRLFYSRNKDGICVYTPNESLYTDVPPNNEPSPSTVNESQTAMLLETVLIPVCVLLLLIGLIFISVRFRVFQNLRDRLRSQVHEDMLLGQPDDNDDPLADPVA